MDPKAKIREMRDALRLGAPHHAAKQLYRLCTLCLCIFDPDMMLHPNWLVVSTPLKNMKVNGKDYPMCHVLWKNKSHVPNHQPD
jgi:hypothetical protein